MNLRFSAQLRRLPACPECLAPPLCACRNAQGNVCAPHQSRERVVSGDLVVFSAIDLRGARQLRAIRELAATFNGKASRAAAIRLGVSPRRARR